MHHNRDLLMLRLNRFFSAPSNMGQVVPIVQGGGDISLRLIDWFITNYAKRHNSVVVVGDSHISIYHSYRTQLKTYSKQQFDPFRRHERIRFVYEGEKHIDTTVGQLNFFRWAVENKVLDYIVARKQDIEREMQESCASPPTAPGGDSKQRTSEVVRRLPTTVTFD